MLFGMITARPDYVNLVRNQIKPQTVISFCVSRVEHVGEVEHRRAALPICDFQLPVRVLVIGWDSSLSMLIYFLASMNLLPSPPLFICPVHHSMNAVRSASLLASSCRRHEPSKLSRRRMRRHARPSRRDFDPLFLAESGYGDIRTLKIVGYDAAP